MSLPKREQKNNKRVWAAHMVRFFIVICLFIVHGSICLATETETFVPNQLIIKLRSGVPVQQHERVFDSSSLSKTFRIFVSSDTDLQTLKNQLERDPNVEYVQFDHFIELCLIPNDPYMNSTGSWGSGLKDQWPLYQIEADKAWDLVNSSREVIVAVIDSGVDYNNPELAGRVDKGVDFSDGDFDAMDEDGHGTHVAGIIAAQGNNGQGMAGLAWNARILPIKIFPYGTEADCARAIEYAADHGARVINMSWQVVGASDSPVLSEAIEYAASKNCVLVAAAGNNGQDVSNFVPANHPEILAVGAVDDQDGLCSFSNYGKKVLLAPGGGSGNLDQTYTILSLKNSNLKSGYYRFSVKGDSLRLAGTSVAAPYVSGLAALILTKNPNLNKLDVDHFVTASTKDLGGMGQDDRFGHGRINAASSLVKVPAYSGSAGGPGSNVNRPDPPDRVKKIKVGGMAFDNDNNMYVVYTNQHKVVKYHLPKDGNVNAASTVQSADSSASTPLRYPMAVAVSGDGSRVFVADTYNNRVLIYDQDLQPVGEISGYAVVTYYKYVKTYKQNFWGLNKYGHHTEEIPVQVAIEGYAVPNDLIVDNDLLYVADKNKGRVLKYRIQASSVNPEPFDVVLSDLLVNLSDEDKRRMEDIVKMQPDAALIRMGSETTLWLSGGEFIGATGILKGGFDFWAALASPIGWMYAAGGVLLSGFIEETKIEGTFHKASSAKVDQIQKVLKVEGGKLREIRVL